MKPRATNFGQMLFRVRKRETQEQFAKRLDISTSYLCDIERGRRRVSVRVAASWASILGESPERFLQTLVQDQLCDSGLKRYHVTVKAR